MLTLKSHQLSPFAALYLTPIVLTIGCSGEAHPRPFDQSPNPNTPDASPSAAVISETAAGPDAGDGITSVDRATTSIATEGSPPAVESDAGLADASAPGHAPTSTGVSSQSLRPSFDAGTQTVDAAATPDGSSSDGGAAPACRNDDDCSMFPAVTCAEPFCSTSGVCTYRALDRDGDGYAASSCEVPDPFGIELGPDCNDDPDIASAPTTHPGAEESCNNLDEDCDGAIDEDIPPDETTECVAPLGATEINLCRTVGHPTCVDGAWTGCSAIPPAPESDAAYCDGFSHDCNDSPNDGCICAPVNSTSDCRTSDLGCDGTRTCLLGDWSSCQLDPGAACDCREGTTRSCSGTNGCPGVQTCGGGNTWGECTCPEVWPCAPGETRGCTSGEGCSGSEVCGSNGQWSGQCVAPRLCPPGWSNEGNTCVWHSAFEGTRINWGQSSCGANSDCNTLTLDAVQNATPTNDMYVEVTLDQTADGCLTDEAVANWIGCWNPSTGTGYGRDVQNWEFHAGVTIPLRCSPGSYVTGFKYDWGHCLFCGCTRGLTLTRAVNHDGPANACGW